MNDRLKRKVVLITVLTVAAVVIGAVIYILRTESPKAELPIRHIGDEWTYRVTEDNVYMFHHEVIVEGTVDNKNCYVIEVIPTPPHEHGTGGICYGGNEWVDKETGLLIKKQISGEFVGTPFTKTLSFTYHTGENLWPLEVGKEVTVTWTLIENDILFGVDIKHQAGMVKVGEREDITVPAGTFTCFRVTFYGDDDVLKTSWYSDSAKHWVKTIYSETGEIYELMSYSNQ